MRFRSIAFALPSRMVTNDDLINELVMQNRETLAPHDLDRLPQVLNNLFASSGTSIRYLRDADELARDLAIRAAQQALQQAELPGSAIDLLIYVGVGRGFLEPATANIFQDALHLKNATCFDILDACASWLRAVDIARCFLNAGIYRNVMIMNCECSYREYADVRLHSLDELEFKFAILTTGEAATVTILTQSEEDDCYHASFRTWGSENKLCQVPLPHYKEFTNGQLRESVTPLRFFSYSQRLFRSVFMKLIHHYRQDEFFGKFEHDIMFGHSASDSMTEHVVQALKINNPYMCHSRFGNTVSASLPLAMAHAIEEGKLHNNMSVLLGVGSAGLSTAWCGFKYL